jgi:hypothetical protein
LECGKMARSTHTIEITNIPDDMLRLLDCRVREHGGDRAGYIRQLLDRDLHVSITPDPRVPPRQGLSENRHQGEEMNPDIPVETASVGKRFAKLTDRWRVETAALSSVTQKAMHPAYQEIIGLGRDAVPLILRELKRRPDHWFWALRAITGEDPIEPNQCGRVLQMAEAWLRWGREHGVTV